MHACKQANNSNNIEKYNNKQRKNKSKQTNIKQKQTNRLPLNWPKQPHKDCIIERCRMPLKCCMHACKQANNSNNIEKMQQQTKKKQKQKN